MKESDGLHSLSRLFLFGGYEDILLDSAGICAVVEICTLFLKKIIMESWLPVSHSDHQFLYLHMWNFLLAMQQATSVRIYSVVAQRHHDYTLRVARDFV